MSLQTNGSGGELEGSESGDAFSVTVRWEFIASVLCFPLCINDSNLDRCLYLFDPCGLQLRVTSNHIAHSVCFKS